MSKRIEYIKKRLNEWVDGTTTDLIKWDYFPEGKKEEDKPTGGGNYYDLKKQVEKFSTLNKDGWYTLEAAEHYLKDDPEKFEKFLNRFIINQSLDNTTVEAFGRDILNKQLPNTPGLIGFMINNDPSKTYEIFTKKDRNEIVYLYYSLKILKNGYDIKKGIENIYGGATDSEVQTDWREANRKEFLFLNKIPIWFYGRMVGFDDPFKYIYKTKKEAKGFRAFRAGGGLEKVVEKRKKIQAETEKSLGLKKLQEAVFGTEGDLGPLAKSLEQCILMAACPDLSKMRARNRLDHITRGGTPYGSRVVPVTPDIFELFMNNMTTPNGGHEFTKNLLSVFPEFIQYSFVVSKVYEVGEYYSDEWKDFGGKKKIFEFPFLFNGNSYLKDLETQKPSFQSLIIGGKYATPNEIKTVIRVQNFPQIIKKIKWKSVDIKFAGSSFATAKSNVDVSLELEMDDLLLLDAKFKAEIEGGVLPGGGRSYLPYEYSVLDLITYSKIGESGRAPAQAAGLGKIFKNQYHPDYNRISLKIIPSIIPEKEVELLTNASAAAKEQFKLFKNFLDQSELSLDLALVDHTISHEQKTPRKASIKIDYKGYIKKHLNDPSMDAILNKKDFAARKQKEKDVLDRIEKAGSTLTEEQIGEEIQTFNEEIKVLKTNGSKKIMAGLAARNQLHGFLYIAADLLDGGNNIANNKIRAPHKIREKVKKLVDSSLYIPTNAPLTGSTTLNVSDYETAVLTNYEIGEFIKFNDGISPGLEFLSFFYLGDLLDVVMDVMYEDLKYTPPTSPPLLPVGYIRHTELMEEEFKNFPVKILLPTIKAKEAVKNPLAGEFSSIYTKEYQLNLADFPIATDYFLEWFQKEVIDTDTLNYPILHFVNKIIATIVSNNLNDTCFNAAGYDKMFFSTAVDYGHFLGMDEEEHLDENLKRTENEARKESNECAFVKALKNGGLDTCFLQGQKSPFIRKKSSWPRSDHCNYIIVYENRGIKSKYGLQINGFQDLSLYNIPHVQLRARTGLNSRQTTSFTKSLAFEKQEANYQREARFFRENLSTLAQLASLYNCNGVTMPYFHFFPGNVIWIDAGLHDAPWTPGSIANILGMGGFHVITQVNHKGTLVAGKINKLETQFKASFILPGNPLVKNNIGRRLKPAQPPPETKPVQDFRELLDAADVADYEARVLDDATSTKQSQPRKAWIGSKYYDHNIAPTIDYYLQYQLDTVYSYERLDGGRESTPEQAEQYDKLEKYIRATYEE